MYIYSTYLQAANKTFSLLFITVTPNGKFKVVYECHQNGLQYTIEEILEIMTK
jgi:hypothetical protein